jgi:hypothetical protein
MNPRVIVAITGTIITALGLAGLFAPERVMGMLGYAIISTSGAASVLGEVRATYGGLFTVMGIFTLLSVVDPAAHRGRLTMIGCLWLGAAAGRLLGVTVDGSPGLFGWLSVVFEGILGSALLTAAWMPSDRPQPASSYVPPTPPPPPPPAPVSPPPA